MVHRINKKTIYSYLHVLFNVSFLVLGFELKDLMLPTGSVWLSYITSTSLLHFKMMKQYLWLKFSQSRDTWDKIQRSLKWSSQLFSSSKVMATVDTFLMICYSIHVSLPNNEPQISLHVCSVHWVIFHVDIIDYTFCWI